MNNKKVEELEKEIKDVDKELHKVDVEISKLKRRQRELQEKKTSFKNSIDKLKSDSLASINWDGMNYPWSENVKKTLNNIFMMDSFRPKQLSAINSTLSGQHVIVVMPTGAGKSLCYQLPALIKDGVTVVVSPLVSLMEDQIRSLNHKNIPALLMSSTSSKQESFSALNQLKDKKSPLKLLYVTPERFAKSKTFLSSLQKSYEEGRLQRIAIDEVHCCSQWGHDFRPDYKFLGIIANTFPKIPILGLTATATAHVLTDIQKMLNIPGCLIIKSTFNRPNLFYKILEKPSSQEECVSILESLLKYRYKGETGIIYTHSIKDCEEITKYLRERNLKVAYYHANMTPESRTSVHTKWHEKYYQAIVATVAFGMGIDKPDVRFVIHHTISKSMENYYQESGRAGRDGKRAECITLYRMQDIFRVSTMVFSSVQNLEHLYGMIKYCLNGNLCRRQLIAEHFDEDWGDTDCNRMCDVCCNPNLNIRETNIEPHFKTITFILDNAKKTETRLTAQKLLDAWFLKGPVTLRHNGSKPNISRSLAEDIIAFLLIENYLVEDFHFTAYSTISYINPGPHLDMVKDPDFQLKMPVRKYTSFELKSQAPNDFELNFEATNHTSNDSKDFTKDKNESSKKNAKEDPKNKKSKTVIIDDSKTCVEIRDVLENVDKKSKTDCKEKCKSNKRKLKSKEEPKHKKKKTVIVDNDDCIEIKDTDP